MLIDKVICEYFQPDAMPRGTVYSAGEKLSSLKVFALGRQ